MTHEVRGTCHGVATACRAACFLLWATSFALDALAAHEGHGDRPHAAVQALLGPGHDVPGLPFRVFVDRGADGSVKGSLDESQADAVLQTVIQALSFLHLHRSDYPRFDEAVSTHVLDRVIIEPTVLNREGKAFPFLVTRTADPGRVRLLISAASMKERGYVGGAERFAPVLAREFQWVVSKADTASKPKTASAERDLRRTSIRTDRDIQAMSGDERVRLLQRLFETYLRTVDEQRSLEGQSYYEEGSGLLVRPSQQDSATKFYDIRVREALQTIVREPAFLERTPIVVTSLLNGKIWNVAFVKIDQRDWATRTRVLPEDKAVTVGELGRTIQPAAILLNTYRTAAPDDPFYADTKSLPMGALSTEQLALVIANEIQHNIVEKSQTGHVVQDALTAPK